MTAEHDDAQARPALGFFERTLTLWVAICIVAGIVLGRLLPGLFHAVGAATIAQVNLPVAVLVWLMIVPMLLRVDPAPCGRWREHWRGIAVTLGVNWLVKPFSMARSAGCSSACCSAPGCRPGRSTAISPA